MVAWAVVGYLAATVWGAVVASLAFAFRLVVTRAATRWARSAGSPEKVRFRTIVVRPLSAVMLLIEIAIVVYSVLVLLYALAVVLRVGDFGR